MADLKRPLVDLACSLVQCPSVLGHEREAADLVSREMDRLGFYSVRRDAAGSVVGTVHGGRTGPTLLLDAHLDTVDVHPRQAWTRDPFGGELENGRIHGRGGSDMKGALASMLLAVGSLERSSLAGRVVVSASVEEERIEGAALRLIMEREQPDFVVIGESSDLNIVRAGRGRAEFVLETHGRPAHASTPDQGLNAMLEMTRVIQQIEQLPELTHPFVGQSVHCFTDIISIPYPAHSVVPSGCRATLERRLLPGETQAAVQAELEDACRAAGVSDFAIELAHARLETYTGHHFDVPKWLDPWEIPEESWLVQTALRAVRQVHPRAGLSSYQFCTNAAYSAGVAGVPTIGFGPSQESQAHVVDEYVEVDQLWKALQGYRHICQALLSGTV